MEQKLEIGNSEAMRNIGKGYKSETIQIETTHIYLNKKFAVNKELKIKLDLINKALQKR